MIGLGEAKRHSPQVRDMVGELVMDKEYLAGVRVEGGVESMLCKGGSRVSVGEWCNDE